MQHPQGSLCKLSGRFPGDLRKALFASILPLVREGNLWKFRIFFFAPFLCSLGPGALSVVRDDMNPMGAAFQQRAIEALVVEHFGFVFKRLVGGQERLWLYNL